MGRLLSIAISAKASVLDHGSGCEVMPFIRLRQRRLWLPCR